MHVRDGIFYISADSRHGQMILRDARRLYICSVSRTLPCRYLVHPYHQYHITTATLSSTFPLFCFALVWILSTSEPCGFFPLGC